MTDQKPAIDLTRHEFKRTLGDFTIYGSWVMNNDQEDYEPCLVIVPARRSRANYRPCCIALSAAFKYNEPQYLAKAIPVFLVNLGMEDCLSNAYKLADLVHSHLRDLITMRPNPTTAIIGADAKFTIDGVSRSIEVVDYVPLAQA